MIRNIYLKFEVNTSRNKQKGHDGPEITHLYIGPQGGANFNPRAFI
jgi:hypothetical protein